MLNKSSLCRTSACLKGSINRYLCTLSAKVKFTEVPDICMTEDWSTAINNGRVALQRHPVKPQQVNFTTGRITLDTVTKRIENMSHSNSYLADTLKQLLEDTTDNACELRWPGLIILMLSRSIQNPFEANNFISKSLEDVIWSSQITLAEIINLLHCYIVFRKEHLRLVSTKKPSRNSKIEKEIDKVVHSYFMSIIHYKSATLHNCKVVQLLGDVLKSLAKTRNMAVMNSTYLPNLRHWEHNVVHPQGLLLASGCQASLELAGHDDATQKNAFKFGVNFALAMKAHAEIKQIWNYQNSQSSTINISSFPIALHLQNHPETLSFVFNCNEELKYSDIQMLNLILQSHSALDDAKLQLETYMQRALGILKQIQSKENNFIEHLTEIIQTLRTSIQ